MARIGLLEDNTRIAKLCATMLQYAGHDVIVYEHPYECLQALLAHVVSHEKWSVPTKVAPSAALPIDVLILDLHLPDMDGLEVIRYLSSHPRTRSLPLIFCTAATPSEIAQALSMVPDASFIEKPFTFQQLTATVKSALALPAK